MWLGGLGRERTIDGKSAHKYLYIVSKYLKMYPYAIAICSDIDKVVVGPQSIGLREVGMLSLLSWNINFFQSRLCYELVW